MSPSKVEGARAWIWSQVQVVGCWTRPLTVNVHDSVDSLGVASAVSTGQAEPTSYWPGGSRLSRVPCPRPPKPLVNLIAAPPFASLSHRREAMARAAAHGVSAGDNHLREQPLRLGARCCGRRLGGRCRIYRSGAGSPGRPRPWLRRGSLWLPWRPQYAPMYRGARRYEARAPPPAAPFIIPAEDPYRARWAPEAGGRATVSAQKGVELVRRGYEALIARD